MYISINLQIMHFQVPILQFSQCSNYAKSFVFLHFAQEPNRSGQLTLLSVLIRYFFGSTFTNLPTLFTPQRPLWFTHDGQRNIYILKFIYSENLILRNRFDHYYIVGDFAKICGLLRIYKYTIMQRFANYQPQVAQTNSVLTGRSTYWVGPDSSFANPIFNLN